MHEARYRTIRHNPRSLHTVRRVALSQANIWSSGLARELLTQFLVASTFRSKLWQRPRGPIGGTRSMAKASGLSVSSVHRLLAGDVAAAKSQRDLQAVD